MRVGQKSLNKKTVHEVKLPHESFLFWCFDFNRATTCAKSQFVPLNQKLAIMPNSVNARKLPDFCPTLIFSGSITYFSASLAVVILNEANKPTAIKAIVK